jgi:hypothetical protein
MTGMIFDAVLLLMMVTTVCYVLLVLKRMKNMHTSKGEMLALCKRLDETVKRAQESIRELKQTSEYVGTHLAKNLELAQAQVGDLHYINDRAQNSINALEVAIRAARPLEQQARKNQQMATMPVMISQRSSVFDANEIEKPAVKTEQKRFALEALLKRVSEKLESKEREEEQLQKQEILSVKRILPPAKTENSFDKKIDKKDKTQAQAQLQDSKTRSRSNDPVENMLRALGYGNAQMA